MFSAACVKFIRSCKCVFFAVFLRPITQRFGGANFLNEINGVNKSVVLFGAVFIPCSTEMWEIDDKKGTALQTAHKRFDVHLASLAAGVGRGMLVAGF